MKRSSNDLASMIPGGDEASSSSTKKGKMITSLSVDEEMDMFDSEMKSVSRFASKKSNNDYGYITASPSLIDLALNLEDKTPPAILSKQILRRSLSSRSRSKSLSEATLDLSLVTSFVADGVGNIVNDSFLACFQSNPPRKWNWNIYLAPPYYVGLIIRYVLLFPLRILILILGALVYMIGLGISRLVFQRGVPAQVEFECGLVSLFCGAFVMSWSGVIVYHGQRPVPSKHRTTNYIFVANHTSMIDAIILTQMYPFSLVGQQHPGWIGFLQNNVLSCLECIWFDRSESRDKKIVAKKLREHALDKDRNPILVFPEGTCVNNEYIVQFKKGVFELDVPIVPVAIKYNRTFADGFWNSKQESFQFHLFRLMTSWAVICDVWFLEPQERKEGEDPVDFAARVKTMIAKTAKLKEVDWDGYMKHYKPSDRFMKMRQKQFADDLKANLLQAGLMQKSHREEGVPLRSKAESTEDIGMDIGGGDTPPVVNVGIRNRVAPLGGGVSKQE